MFHLGNENEYGGGSPNKTVEWSIPGGNITGEQPYEVLHPDLYHLSCLQSRYRLGIDSPSVAAGPAFAFEPEFTMKRFVYS